MRKMRFLVVAALAALGVFSAVAIAQENVYEISGSTSKGGTKKKPKATGLDFGFKVRDSGGNLPKVIQKFSIGFEGMTTDSSFLPKCTASAMTAAKSDASCPAKALFGTGTVDALIGTTGQSLDNAAKCRLDLSLYNSGGKKAALWLQGGPPSCIASISQAIDAKFVAKNGGTALEFEVPESLRHQLGLDVAVVDVTTKIKKITGKKGKKKTGFFLTTGCADKQRDITVTFTDEAGAATPAKKTIAC